MNFSRYYRGAFDPNIIILDFIKKVFSVNNASTGETKSTSKKYIISAIMLLMLGVVITIIVIHYNVSSTASVPQLIGINSAIACEMLEEKDLKVDIIEEYHDTIKKGVVITQSPNMGEKVSKNSTVYLVVSKGKEQEELIPVLSVSGYDEVTAKSKLEELGLVVETTEEYNDTVKVGNVISQSPVGGTEVRKNSTVYIVVSKGKEPEKLILIPSVSGYDEATAKSKLEELGLVVEITEEYNDTVKVGKVISQSPAVGTEVRKNSTVYIVASKGKEPEELILIPSVSGYDEATAKSKLEELGLEVKTKEQYHDTVEEGKVINQIPNAGEKVEKGTTVEITLSKGSGLVIVPSVINMDKNNAETNLVNAGFKVNIQEEYSEDAATGQVIAQNPSANTREPEGSTVTITISKGAKPYAIYYESNGGSSIASQTGYSGRSLGDLPVPERDYYTFTGWYTADGTKVGSDTIFKNINSIKLVAHWEQKVASEWTLWSQAPVDAWVVNEKWTYTEKTIATSENPSMNGYTCISKDWQSVGTGSIDWTEFPSGYNTDDDFYETMEHSQPSDIENESTKRIYNSPTANGWIYWHWADSTVEGGSVVYQGLYRRTISYRKWSVYSEWHAEWSATDYPVTNPPNPDRSGGLQHYQVGGLGDYCDAPFGYSVQNWTNLYFRIAYNTSTFTDYKAIYTHQKTETKESNSAVTEGGNISDVLHWVRYIPK